VRTQYRGVYLEDARAAALPQSPQVSRWPFPLSCLITTAGWLLLREEALALFFLW